MDFLNRTYEIRLKKFLSANDFTRLSRKLTRNVESATIANDDEEKIIDNIAAGKNVSFSQSLWGLAGPVDSKNIMRSYNELLRETPALRTHYIYEGMSERIRVVYYHSISSFPIIDISNLNSKEQTKFLEKFVSSKARFEYNPESENILNLHAFLIEKDKLLLWVGFYHDLCKSVNLYGIIKTLFKDFKIYMSSSQTNDISEVDSNYDEKVKESVNYWLESIKPIGKALNYPGESNTPIKSFDKNSVYKVVDKSLTDKINDYCLKNNVSLKSVWLLAWGYMLSFYNSENQPLLAVETKHKKHFVAPVKILRNAKSLDNVKEIDKILKSAAKYNNCSLENICESADIDMHSYFKMLHSFLDLRTYNSVDQVVNNATELGFSNKPSNYKIRVLYYYYVDEVGLNYVYYREAFYDSAIEQMHKLLIDVVTEIVSSDENKFEKNYFENALDSNVEKLLKKDLKNKADYLKKSGLFGDRSDEDFLILSEKVQLRRYSANDIIIKEGTASHSIGILIEGMLEESRVDMDGIVHTIRLCKPFTLISIEGLFDENVLSSTLSAYSDEAKVLFIERPDIYNFLSSSPDTWSKLLKACNDSLVTMKKLWTSQ